MDKLFRSSWFIKIISFLIALMLFTMVSAEQQPTKNSSAVLLGNNPQSTTLNENLDAKYDKAKLVIFGLPDSVQVQVKGNSEQILKTRYTTTKSVYVDLTGKGPGTYSVQPQVSGFPSDAKISVIPSTIQVTLQKKVTRTFVPTVDLINKASMTKGYSLGVPVLSPGKVTVTGGNKVVDAIAFVKGVISVSGLDGPVNQDVALNAYDKNGNQLDVTLNPTIVRVKIPVVSPSKVIPIDVQLTGSPPSGESVKSVTLSSQTIKLYGNPVIIDGIDSIHNIPLNLNNLNSQDQEDVTIPVPQGADQVQPEKVTATVTFDQTVTKTLNQIPVIVNDSTQNQRSVTFDDPKGKTINVTLSGASSLINKIQASDIEAVINIESLSTGQHVVPISLTTPEYITGTPSQTTATVTIK